MKASVLVLKQPYKIIYDTASQQLLTTQTDWDVDLTVATPRSGQRSAYDEYIHMALLAEPHLHLCETSDVRNAARLIGTTNGIWNRRVFLAMNSACLLACRYVLSLMYKQSQGVIHVQATNVVRLRELASENVHFMFRVSN